GDVLVVRGHRVRLEDVVARGWPGRRQEPGRAGAALSAVGRRGASWVEREENNGPEGFDPGRVRGRGRVERPDVGVEGVLPEQALRRVWRDDRERVILWVAGRIARWVMPSLGSVLCR